MSFFRFRWLHRIIRRNTNPIPEENAARWKRRLAIGYAFFAWNAFGFVCYAVYQGKGDWAAARGLKSPEELALTPGQQWARTMGKPNAEIYRIKGFGLEKIEKPQENKDAVELSNDSKREN